MPPFDPVRDSPPSRPHLNTVLSHASSSHSHHSHSQYDEDVSPPPTPQQRAMSINALVASAELPTPSRASFAVGALLNDDNGDPPRSASRKSFGNGFATSPTQSEAFLQSHASSSQSPSMAPREPTAISTETLTPRTKMSMDDVMNADNGTGGIRKRIDPVREARNTSRSGAREGSSRSPSPARKKPRIDSLKDAPRHHALHIDTSASSDSSERRGSAATPHSTHSQGERIGSKARVESVTKSPSAPTPSKRPLPTASPPPTQDPIPRLRYQPIHRVSAPTTVRHPISWLEAEGLLGTCRNPLRLRWEREHAELFDRIQAMGLDKPKWGPSEGWDAHAARVAEAARELENPKKSKKSGAQRRKESVVESPVSDKPPSMVAAHYNARKDQGMMVRDTSPIIPMRKFNNWIKSVIIRRFARGPGPNNSAGRVLELGCGKGGDLQKWARCKPEKVVMIDIAEISVQQARSRYDEGRTKGQLGYDADFYAFDCFHQPLSDAVPRQILESRFDNVSLQFCMHYGWSTPSSARLMLENISRYLRIGGTFIGTIPDDVMIRDRLQSAPPDSLEFGNSIYQVRFKQRGAWPPYGNEYNFLLVDAVDDVPEFVVDWHAFIGFASEFGLEPIFDANFEQMYIHERLDPDFGPMLERMVGHDPQGHLRVPVEMWEACTFYKAFAFEKVREAGQPLA